MHCVYCGSENPGFASFCERCGKSTRWRTGVPSLEAQCSDSIKGASTEDSVEAPADQGQSGAQESGPAANPNSGPVSVVSSVGEHCIRDFDDTAQPSTPTVAIASQDKNGNAPASPAKTSDLLSSHTSPEPRRRIFYTTPQSFLLSALWLIALFVYNIYHRLPVTSSNGLPYILLDGAAHLTSLLHLYISAAVFFGIFTIGKKRAPDRLEAWSAGRSFLFVALCTICIYICILTMLSLARKAIRSTTVQSSAVASTSEAGRVYVKDRGAEGEATSSDNANGSSDRDGIDPEVKRQMRQMLALQFNGSLQQEYKGLNVNATGDRLDVLHFSWPSMNDEFVAGFIRGAGDGSTSNFWNALRLTGFTEIVFSGNGYRNTIPRETFTKYGKGYEQYKSGFLKHADAFVKGLRSEDSKP